jgi:hypothetical protein
MLKSGSHSYSDVNDNTSLFMAEIYMKWCNANGRSFMSGGNKFYSAPYNKYMGLDSKGYYMTKRMLNLYFVVTGRGEDWDIDEKRNGVIFIR